MERQGQTTSRVLPYLVRLVIDMARARWGVRAWLAVQCGASWWDWLAADAQKES